MRWSAAVLVLSGSVVPVIVGVSLIYQASTIQPVCPPPPPPPIRSRSPGLTLDLSPEQARQNMAASIQWDHQLQELRGWQHDLDEMQRAHPEDR